MADGQWPTMVIAVVGELFPGLEHTSWNSNLKDVVAIGDGSKLSLTCSVHLPE
jgi:hypothetical protein